MSDRSGKENTQRLCILLTTFGNKKWFSLVAEGKSWQLAVATAATTSTLKVASGPKISITRQPTCTRGWQVLPEFISNLPLNRILISKETLYIF